MEEEGRKETLKLKASKVASQPFSYACMLVENKVVDKLIPSGVRETKLGSIRPLGGFVPSDT